MGEFHRGHGPVALDGVGHIGERSQLSWRGQGEMEHLRAVGLGVHHQLAHRDRRSAALGPRLVEPERARPWRAIAQDVSGAHGR